MSESFIAGFVIAALGILVLWATVDYIHPKSKSWWYRKYLTNLFVAGKIRQFANSEDVDLLVEAKLCENYIMKSKVEGIKHLDNLIESGIAEKIGEAIHKDKEKD